MRVNIEASTVTSIGMLWNLDLVWQHWRDPFSGLLTRVQTAGARLAADTDLDREQRAAWRRDPMSHPDLQAMSQRARDDLPFDPRAFTED